MASGQYGGEENSQVQGNQRPPPERLTDEETKVLKECESESFFRRALPLSVGVIAGVQYLVRTGKLSGHPRFGAIPKSIIAGGIAYMFGKLSYLPECRKKILERIPNSNIAQSIKKGENRPLPNMGSQQDSVMDQQSDGDSKQYSNYATKLPTDTPTYEGLNDSQRPSVDNEVKMPDEPEQKKSSTYDDLRQRNRQDYKDSLSTPKQPGSPGPPSYKDSPYMPQKAWPDKREPPASAPDQAPTKRKRTNMWGDVIED